METGVKRSASDAGIEMTQLKKRMPKDTDRLVQTNTRTGNIILTKPCRAFLTTEQIPGYLHVTVQFTVLKVSSVI